MKLFLNFCGKTHNILNESKWYFWKKTPVTTAKKRLLFWGHGWRFFGKLLRSFFGLYALKRKTSIKPLDDNKNEKAKPSPISCQTVHSSNLQRWNLTVWKFQDFSITQIIREINFRNSGSWKTAIFALSEAPNFVLLISKSAKIHRNK